MLLAILLIVSSNQSQGFGWSGEINCLIEVASGLGIITLAFLIWQNQTK